MSEGYTKCSSGVVAASTLAPRRSQTAVFIGFTVAHHLMPPHRGLDTEDYLNETRLLPHHYYFFLVFLLFLRFLSTKCSYHLELHIPNETQ